MDKVISQEEPVRLSDGFRHEHCFECGRLIGYGRFYATKVDYWFHPVTRRPTPVWVLTHETGGCID